MTAPGPRERERLRLFTNERTAPDSTTLERLRLVSRLPYIAAPVVAMADLHWKENLETPSSTASATTSDIVMTLSSSSQNCGMTLLRTPLDAQRAGDRGFLARLMTAFREEIPRSRGEPIITRDEAFGFVMGGAVAAAERYGLDPALLGGIEYRGSLFADGEMDRAAILDVLDEQCLERGRYSFAYIGGGNHFLEVQEVEKVHDRAACDALGLSLGQILIMYHTGSERLGHDLGRLYAVRLKTSTQRRRKYFFRKIPLHLTRGVRGPGDLVRRWRYHFSRRTYIPVPAGSVEGKRLVRSLKAAGNYGYANRVAVLDLIFRALRRVTGEGSDGYQILSDLSHNVIARERVGGRPLWVHRHNTVRLRPPSEFPEGSLYRKIGQPAMLPGTNRCSSYLIVSREGCGAALNSVDHGAGKTVDRFLEAGLLREIPDVRTMKFTYRSAIPEILTHVTDDGIDEVVSLLTLHGIAVPAARLRPLAVLKG